MNGLSDMFESFALESMNESIEDMVCEAQDMRFERDLFFTTMEAAEEDQKLEADEMEFDDATLECGMGMDIDLGFDAMGKDDIFECGDVSEADLANISECDEAFVASVFDGVASESDMRGLEMEMSRVF